LTSAMRLSVPVLGLAVVHSCALLGRQSPLPDRSATPEAKFKIAGTIVSSLDRHATRESSRFPLRY